MTNEEQKLRELVNGISAFTTRKELMERITALISEHYVAKEEVDKMVAERCKKCKHKGLPNSIQEALNSGDGVYRP